MKKFLVTLLSVIWVCALASTASALPFSNTIDWSPNIDIYDRYDYVHNLNLDPPGTSVNSATLSIRHKNNQNNYFEVWYVWNEDSDYIGRLSDSMYGYVTDTFNLSQSILNEIADGNPWQLIIHLGENTSGYDRITLDRSTLAGDYNPVPEPASLILLGSGLAGLAFRRRRK